MPRYFIHIWNSTGFVPDEEGQELTDADTAIGAALDSIRSIVSEEARSGLIELRGRARVEDDQGRTVAEFPFGEAFDLYGAEELR
ncbi:hypothetical protein [Sphingomonas sp. ID1715]|uniref:DUF6894 family protein n=1 Tax=Sphingomonas sp. ID1715 TaxID=1656898 RepID=UPI0020C23DF4|nr:hypothetical protein [Sphingomonas sp. ID1715]